MYNLGVSELCVHVCTTCMSECECKSVYVCVCLSCVCSRACLSMCVQVHCEHV